MRFFLTAPCFGILAGVLVLWGGVDVFASRWTPAALALVHLITAGFMLQAMLGAMLQILPVLVGANMARPTLVAAAVHAAVSLGALFLAAAFLSFSPSLFRIAAVLLGFGIALFAGAAARALYGLVSTNTTTQGLKLSLLGLTVTAGLGITMSGALGWSLNVPLAQLAEIHMGWGFVGWGAVLLAAVGLVVVPMFQLTPAYPDWFGRFFPTVTLAVAALWSLAEFVAPDGLKLGPRLLGIVLVGLAALFAGVTLSIQRRSKRARFDASQHFWRVGMASALAACAVCLAGVLVPAFAEWSGWAVLCGVLVLFGGFMSVIIGMLYKIVPFLVWLHLQNQGQGRVVAPNMKKIIAEREMERQMMAHFVSYALLLLAVFWPTVFVYPAGVALLVANAWLLRNLLAALSLYRGHLLKIEMSIRASTAQ